MAQPRVSGLRVERCKQQATWWPGLAANDEPWRGAGSGFFAIGLADQLGATQDANALQAIGAAMLATFETRTCVHARAKRRATGLGLVTQSIGREFGRRNFLHTVCGLGPAVKRQCPILHGRRAEGCASPPIRVPGERCNSVKRRGGRQGAWGRCGGAFKALGMRWWDVLDSNQRPTD